MNVPGNGQSLTRIHVNSTGRILWPPFETSYNKPCMQIHSLHFEGCHVVHRDVYKVHSMVVVSYFNLVVGYTNA